MYEPDLSKGAVMSSGARVKIEAVIVCVNYADFLAHTLPHDLVHFDKIVVVTAPFDTATQRVCEHYGVKCHQTDAMQAQWKGKFHKGAGIAEGLELLDRDAWIVHKDADVVMPPHFRKVVQGAQLDTRMIYGADRAEFKTFEDWERFYQAPEPHTQGGFLTHTSHTGQLLGTRLTFPHSGGYLPIGYFQMWHADSGVRTYMQGHGDAGREDCTFATQWPRSRRALIPEVIVYHLESGYEPMAVNWKGRESKPFGVAKRCE